MLADAEEVIRDEPVRLVDLEVEADVRHGCGKGRVFGG
jgi:hypothetical protein